VAVAQDLHVLLSSPSLATCLEMTPDLYLVVDVGGKERHEPTD
jgi:hypothetical protein